MLALVLLLGAAIEVRGSEGCVDTAAVVTAVDAVGGIDVAEAVVVEVTLALDDGGSPPADGQLVVEVRLVGAPPLRRAAQRRAVECRDVPYLVPFLVKNQRTLADEPAADAAPITARRDRRARAPSADARPTGPRAVAPVWSLCDGPPSFGPLRLPLSAGAGTAMSRFALDLGWNVDAFDALDVHGAVEVHGRGRIGVGGGVAWNARVGDVFGVSARGTIGAVAGASDYGVARLGVAPSVTVRAGAGFVFVEAGGFFHVGLDDGPGGWVAVGVMLAGP